MKSFWEGFEKRAYDFDWERKELEDSYKNKSGDTVISPKSALLPTMSILGGLGAAMGGTVNPPHFSGKGALLGGLIGAGGGALLGHLIRVADQAAIDEAKKVMAMDEKDRNMRIHSEARRNEIDELEFNADMRTSPHRRY